jgi:hypothetical protein
MKRSSRPRSTAELSKSLHQQLTMYALAASAAGVSVLALAQSSEAKIVYTHVHKVIRPNSHLDIDLNHDSSVDFRIRNVYRSNTFYKVGSLGASGVQSPIAVEGMSTFHSGRRALAFALHRGARIGPAKPFSGTLMVRESIYNFGGVRGYWWSRAESSGNPRPHYLGLKFQVKGKIHFGWARLIITVAGDAMTATLTDYAYETIPNKPIIAGSTKGADESTNEDLGPDASLTNPNPDTPEPATLGALAMGAPGLSAWRRNETSLDGR